LGFDISANDGNTEEDIMDNLNENTTDLFPFSPSKLRNRN
jgi:hypothetical protein